MTAATQPDLVDTRVDEEQTTGVQRREVRVLDVDGLRALAGLGAVGHC